VLDGLSFASLGLAPGEIAFCLGVVAAAGFMRGFTGFGFAMAGVPLLAIVIAPAKAVPYVIVLQLAMGIWDWREIKKRAHWPTLPWLMAGALIGTPIGAAGLVLMSADWARLAIAASVLLAVVLLARGMRFAKMPPPPALGATGMLAGVLNGVAAMPGPPVIVLFLAGPLSVEVGRASMVGFFAYSNAVGAVTAGVAGLLNWGIVFLALVSVPLLLGAQWLGRRAYARGGDAMYRRVALWFLAALSLLTAVRAAAGLV